MRRDLVLSVRTNISLIFTFKYVFLSVQIYFGNRWIKLLDSINDKKLSQSYQAIFVMSKWALRKYLKNEISTWWFAVGLWPISLTTPSWIARNLICSTVVEIRSYKELMEKVSWRKFTGNKNYSISSSWKFFRQLWRYLLSDISKEVEKRRWETCIKKEKGAFIRIQYFIQSENQENMTHGGRRRSINWLWWNKGSFKLPYKIVHKAIKIWKRRNICSRI